VAEGLDRCEGRAVGDAWMPGAAHMRIAVDGGEMKGGAPRAVWITLDADPQRVSARSAAQRLVQVGHPCHLVWNPLTGETVQLIPIVRAACSLGDPAGLRRQRAADTRRDVRANGHLVPEPEDAAAEVRNEGRLCVQIGVVDFGWTPFTSGPMTGLSSILDWLDSWRIPRRWPAGRPAPFAHAHTAPRNRRLWACGGYFGVSQVPGSLAAGPGAIDIDQLAGGPGRRVQDTPLQRTGTAPKRQVPAGVSRMGGVLTEGERADTLARAG
jgi:hypothetical protein